MDSRGYLSAGRVEVPPAAMGGVVRAARVRERGLSAWDLRVPHWLTALAAAILPGVYGHRRRRRPPPGRCPACGYDLRATPGRCPVCGGSATG